MLMIGLATGCESNDERLAGFAEQAVQQQAHQNTEIARQSHEVASHSRELAEAAPALVEQDAASRRALIDSQAQFQTHVERERSRLDEQQEQLRTEQKSLASARIREPIVAQAILVSGVVLAALLPLIVTAYALTRLPATAASDEELLSDALLEELAAQPPVPRNGAAQAPTLPSPDRPLLPDSGAAPARGNGPDAI
jgi:hypothetical protein